MNSLFRSKYSIASVLLLYYSYLNPLRKLVIPLSEIVIPLMLSISLFCIAYSGHFKISYRSKCQFLLFASWISILVLILFHNVSLKDTLITGGYIQLFVMVFFLIFSNYNTLWLKTFFKWGVFAALLYALTTIVFYYNPSLYLKFLFILYEPEKVASIMRFFDLGWISGICDHFSTNGMVLSMGCIFIYEYIRHLQFSNSVKIKKYWYVFLLVVFYALILSSKRGPLIAALVSIFIVYCICSSGNTLRKILKAGVVLAVVFFLVQFFSDYIPGLSTIADKFQFTEKEGDVLQGRDILWDLAYKMFDSSPFLGEGYGSYAIYAEKSSLFTSTAHNLYLEILSQLGLLGLFLYMLAFTSCLIISINMLKLLCFSNHNSFDICILKISTEIQIFVLVYGMTGSTLSYYTILIPFFMACSCAVVIQNKYKYFNK